MIHSIPAGGLLHLDASVSDHSVSRELTALFADHWRRANDPAGHRYRDLVADPVPQITHAYVNLGERVERQGTVALDRIAELARDKAEREQWALTRPLIDELRAAETVLMGAPMHNFTVSTALKAWIDRMNFPGAYRDPDTNAALLADTTVVVVASRGGGYGPGTPREGFDFQAPYLRRFLTNLGVAEPNLHLVTVELTRVGEIPALAGLEHLAAQSLAAARARLTELAARPVEAAAVAG